MDGTTPSSRFFGFLHPRPNINEYHPFECPVFVLDARIQIGQIDPPKWEPRTRVGIYLGHSPIHAVSIAMVFKPKTGHVSPQYHVVFDENFTTVINMGDGILPPTWEEMCQKSTESATDEAFDMAKNWFTVLTKDSEGRILDPFAVISDKYVGKWVFFL